MPDDPLETQNNPAPAPAPAREGRGCTCEFCGCTLTPRGEVLRMGDKAKEFRDTEEKLEKLRKDVSAAEGRAVEAERKAQDAERKLEAINKEITQRKRFL